MPEWRDVKGWEGEYEVSDNGMVRRTQLTYRNGYRGEVLQRETQTGYWQVWLGGRNGRNHYVHRLVAFSFIGPPPSDRHEIAHFDGNKKNNSLGNIRWATKVENTEDKRRQDRHPKLTSQNVRDIRLRGLNEPASELAKEFGVGYSHIRRIMRNMMWKDLQ